MDIRIMNLSLLRLLKIKHETIKGYKIVLFKVLSFTITHGKSDGNHINISVGIFNVETFIGFSLWNSFTQ